MATLSQIKLDFNRQIKLSPDGDSLSSDTGLFLFREFNEKPGFSQTLIKHLHLNDKRSYFIHSNEKLLCQKMYQMMAGYPEDEAADQWTEVPVFTHLIGTVALASQPSLSRFFRRFDAEPMAQLEQANQELLDKVHTCRQSRAIIFDLDSTHADAYGHQESITYNVHYETVGFHPLVAFDRVTDDFLKAKLRSGHVYTSDGGPTLD